MGYTKIAERIYKLGEEEQRKAGRLNSFQRIQSALQRSSKFQFRRIHLNKWEESESSYSDMADCFSNKAVLIIVMSEDSSSEHSVCLFKKMIFD